MNAPAGAPAAMLAGVTLALTHLGLRAARARATVRRLVPRTAGGRGGLPPTRLPRPPRWLAPRLAEVGVAVRAERMWAAWTAATVLSVLVGASVGGVGLALVVTVAAVGAPVVAWGSYRHRGDAMVEAALPPFLEGVARSLRAGAGLRQAVVEATPAAPRALTADLARVVAATERGSTLSAALDDWGRRRPLPGLRLAVSALCLGSETGGAQARALDGVAATLRQRLEAVADARALAGQARASALVIAASPVAFGALASALDAGTMTFLLRTPAGIALLVTGLALDAAAGLWMARLTRLQP